MLRQRMAPARMFRHQGSTPRNRESASMVDYRLHSSVAAAVFILILLGTRVSQDTRFPGNLPTIRSGGVESSVF